jgi:predicted TIM-barrel fold metal-dependent hydrolase
MKIIDCDLHNTVPSAEALFPYLSAHWREYISQSAFKGPVDTAYPAGAPTSARPGTIPPDGGPPGSSLVTLQAQVLDVWKVEFGILNCAYAVESLHNPDAATIMASAVNQWQIAEWLQKEPRLRASLVVPSHYPELAAREIERLGDHPGFVQVFLPVRSAAPYGNRRYWPIYEAAVRHNLVIGLHFGGSPGNPPTPAGWPSYYIEEYVGMSQIFQSQVISLIAEGVFDQFPALRVALIEGGFTWLPSLMWRMDKEWKGLRREIPWVKRLPSEYIREHVSLTLQPLDSPPDSYHLRQIMEQLESDDMLMFSTDYPHWHFNSSEEALPVELAPEVERKIMAENARAFYRL